MNDKELILDAIKRINKHLVKHNFEVNSVGSQFNVKIDGKDMVVQNSAELLISYLDGFETAIELLNEPSTDA